MTCQFEVSGPVGEGINTGRPRYRVACSTCDRVVHPGTTSPPAWINDHLREVDGRVFPSSYAVLSTQRLHEVAADDHRAGTVGEARAMARELLERRHQMDQALSDRDAFVAGACAYMEGNFGPYETRLDAFRSLLRLVRTKTKHGPRGAGERGPCDPDCLKCLAERVMEKIEVPRG